MKVLQTLGASGQTGFPGIFYYRRTPTSIEIFDSRNPDRKAPSTVIPSSVWEDILREIQNHEPKSFTLSDQENGLYAILSDCGVTNTTQRAQIAAILEHEGSIDLNGRNQNPINLVNDMG